MGRREVEKPENIVGQWELGVSEIQQNIHEIQYFSTAAVDWKEKGDCIVQQQHLLYSNTPFSSQDETRNHLFQSFPSQIGLDLPAIDIQRGRDHGLQPWIKYRGLCQLKVPKSFTDLQKMDIMPEVVVARLAAVYGYRVFILSDFFPMTNNTG